MPESEIQEQKKKGGGDGKPSRMVKPGSSGVQLTQASGGKATGKSRKQVHERVAEMFEEYAKYMEESQKIFDKIEKPGQQHGDRKKYVDREG